MYNSQEQLGGIWTPGLSISKILAMASTWATSGWRLQILKTKLLKILHLPGGEALTKDTTEVRGATDWKRSTGNPLNSGCLWFPPFVNLSPTRPPTFFSKLHFHSETLRDIIRSKCDCFLHSYLDTNNLHQYCSNSQHQMERWQVRSSAVNRCECR